MQIVIEIDDEDYKTIQELDSHYSILFGKTKDNAFSAIKNGIPLPEHHGDLKDIGDMELLNVQVHDDYSKGWHNAIEYCVRRLREHPTIIPATKEGAE